MGEAVPRDPQRHDAAGSRARADAMIGWLRQYTVRRIEPALSDAQQGVAPDVVLDLGDAGLFGLQVARALGGQALSNADVARVLQQLAAVDLSLAMLVAVHNCLGLRPLLQFGPGALQHRLLPRLASGRELAAYARAEPDAGSNAAAMRARADRVGGGWRLCAHKHMVALGPWAGLSTVMARAFGADGAGLGPVALLVPAEAPGLTLGPQVETLGLRGIAHGALRCADVFVPDAQVLLAPGEGARVAADAAGFGRLAIGALCVGAMKRCALSMAGFAARREITTGPLLDNAVTRARLDELTCAVAAVEALVAAIAATLDARGALPQHACAAVKAAGSELLWESVDRLLQLQGARGYLDQCAAARMLRDARALRIVEGSTEELYMLLGAAAAPDSGAEHYLAEGLGRPLLAQELGGAVAAIRARAAGPFESGSAAVQWLDYRIGELCVSALLLGAAERDAAGEGGPDAPAAVAWARARFDAQRRAIEAEQLSRRACAMPSQLQLRVAAYGIGGAGGDG